MLPEIWKNSGSLLAPTMDDFIEKFFYGWPQYEKETDVSWSPRVDINESDKEITIEAELTGIKKEDVKVEVKNNTLTISGERKHAESIEKGNYYRMERHYGKFERSFGLPQTVQSDKVNAKFKDGILTLTLPKSEKAIPKEITVNVE